MSSSRDGGLQGLPDVAGRLALQAGQMREGVCDGRAGGGLGDVGAERVVEVEHERVAQLEDADGGERLRDRADPVRVLRRRRLVTCDVGQAERPPPEDLAVPEHRGADRGHPLLGLRGRDELVEPRRRGPQAAARIPSACGTSSIARSTSSSSTSRWVTARMSDRVDRGREPDARLAQRRERLALREAERADVQLDEVRLDLVEIDGQARPRSSLRQAGGRGHGRPRGGRRGGRGRTRPLPRRCPPGAWRRRRGASPATRARSTPRCRRAAPRAGSRGPSRGRA